MARKRHLDTDSPSTSAAPMTLDEYYAMRAAEEQDKYYLQGSRNRKESYKLTYREPYTADDERLDREWINNLANTLSRATGLTKGEIYDRIENGTLTGTEQLQADSYNINTVRNITDTVDRVINKRNEWLLANCIATATSNNPNKGHFVTGNQTFAANPSKYGFKKVTKDEAKPGSLVQAVSNSSNIPFHAMILNYRNGKDETYNYSPGRYPDYKINVKYPEDGKVHHEYYNFVGNEADSARWKNEYEQSYKQKYGGCVPRRALATGGTVTLPTLVVTPSKPITSNALLSYARTDLQNAIMDRLLSNFKGYATLRRKLASKRNIDFNRPLFT